VHSVRRLFYNMRSFSALLAGVRNWPALLAFLRQPKPARPVALTLRDGTSFTVDSLTGAWAVKSTSLDRAYERYAVPIQDGWNVVDLGAGLGDFTIFAALRTPHGRVYAYEPMATAAGLLRHNLALNQIGNVTLFPYRIASHRGDAVPVLQPADHGPVPPPVTRANAVRCVTLSDVLADLPGGTCDFLKMDGAAKEYEILLNTPSEVLRQIRRLCFKYEDCRPAHTHDELASFLEAGGWRIRLYRDSLRPQAGYLYAERSDQT
jgi:FkbM family methyltransferase